MLLDANTETRDSVTALTSATAIVAVVAVARVVLLALVAPRYGWFGDEMYYLACAEHLDWGYVDQPPLIVAVAWVVRRLFGPSLVAFRLVPALFGSVKVVLAAAIARRLGGGRAAQALTAIAVAVAPVYLAIDHLFSMNTLEPVIWMACALLVIRVIRTGDQRTWLWFGALSGLGLQAKYSMAVFGLGVVVALLLTPERRAFRSRWIWMGGAIALAIFLPNLVWNVRHDWPFLELMRNIRESGRDVRLPLLLYVRQQALMIGPAAFLLSLAGTAWLLFARAAKPFRALAWVFLFVFAFFLAQRAKDYYTAPVYPLAVAAGAIALERAAGGRRWLSATTGALLVALAAPFAPIVIPVLPVETYYRYQEAFPFRILPSEQGHAAAKLPHHYAWSFGWEEMVAATARVYHSLPPRERAQAAIFANNFAEAGAIDLLGPKYGLPKAVGGHQSYFLWGPRGYSGQVVIVLGDEPEDAAEWFESVEVAAWLNHPWASPWENGPILVGRGLRVDLREAWPGLKEWN